MLGRLGDLFGGARRKALDLRPPGHTAPAPRDWIAEGNAHLHAGRLADAAVCYGQAVREAPDNAAARLNLGYVQLEAGELEAARSSLERAVSLAGEPAQRAEAQYFLARALRGAGDDGAALSAYEAALDAQPDFRHALLELADWLLALGRPEDAERHARRARLLGQDPDVDVLLARAAYDQHRFDEVLSLLDPVLQHTPQHAVAREGRGSALMALNRPADALVDFEEAIACAGESPTRLVNLAAALYQMGRLDQAEPVLERALVLEPRATEAIYNLAMLRADLLRLDDALALANQGLQAVPGDPDLRWIVAMVRLLQGDWTTAWADYEARWHMRWATPGAARHLRWPLWDGSPLAGRRLLITQEQGLGDMLQMLRVMPLLAREASEVLVEVPQTLRPLLGAMPPNVRCVELAQAQADVVCTVMSLPGLLRMRPDTVPSEVPYLATSPATRSRWAARIAPQGRLRVGLVWSGNPRQVDDRRRSIPLSLLRGLETAGVEFFALQPQVRPADQATLDAWPELRNLGPAFADFGETAGAIEALDLVITVDTSVAHLAGALGRPTWILLSFRPDWRWLVGRSDSPWYPTARLFRQPRPGDWDAVITEVRAALQSLAQASAPTMALVARDAADAVAPDARDLAAQGDHQRDRGDAAGALALYRQASVLADDAELLLKLGIRLAAAGDPAAALRAFERGLQAQPDHASLALHAALLVQRAGDPVAFRTAAQRAADARPPSANAFLLLSEACREGGDVAAALTAIEAALRLEPARADLHVNHFQLLKSLGRQKDALAAVDAALAFDLRDPDLLTNVLAAGGYCEETIIASRAAADAHPEALLKRSCALFYGNFDEKAGVQSLFEAHRALGEHIERSVRPVYENAWLGSADAGRVLRIGFVSSDLSQHPVTLFLLTLLSHLDRSRFEVHCYNSTLRRDAATEAVQRASHGWVEAQKLSDAQLAQRIHADGIDILVDLAGHSSTPRVGAFAFRPAPVQVGWLGYLNTTGLRRMDYRLCDARTDPPATQRFETEQLSPLPRSHW